MDKITTLIKEARPLYKQRKRQKAILSTTFCALVLMLFINASYQVYLQGEEVYLSLENNHNLKNELIYDEFDLYGIK